MSTPADQDPENIPAAADPSFAPTEIMHTDAPDEPERRFTAPSAFDAGSTQIISTPPEPATEIFDMPGGAEPPTAPSRTAAPQAVPTRPIPPKRNSWGWVVALILVIAALVAVVILVVVLLTRGDSNAAGLTQLGATVWSANSGGPAV